MTEQQLSRRHLAGIKSRDKLLAKNPNYYSEIGGIGGRRMRDSPRGFALMTPERLRELASKGGSVSRKIRKKPTNKSEKKL